MLEGAKQLVGAGALVAAVAEPLMLAFHSLGPPMLFGVPKPGPTLHLTIPGVSLATLQSVAMPAVNAHGSRWRQRPRKGVCKQHGESSRASPALQGTREGTQLQQGGRPRPLSPDWM